MNVRPMVQPLKAGELNSAFIPYEAIKNWQALKTVDFLDGEGGLEFLL